MTSLQPFLVVSVAFDVTTALNWLSLRLKDWSSFPSSLNLYPVDLAEWKIFTSSNLYRWPLFLEERGPWFMNEKQEFNSKKAQDRKVRERRSKQSSIICFCVFVFFLFGWLCQVCFPIYWYMCRKHKNYSYRSIWMSEMNSKSNLDKTVRLNFETNLGDDEK